jgi:hypothetical protein
MQAMRTLIILLLMAMAVSIRADGYTLKPVNDAEFATIASEKLGVEALKIERFNDQRIGHTPDGERVLLTGDYASPVGYRGPTSVMLLLDEQMQQVKQAVLVESCDSPPYVKRAVKKGMLRCLNGAAVIDEEVTVDAVSGATRTCDAVEQAVNQTIKQIVVDNED